jgi:hypothetical protein
MVAPMIQSYKQINTRKTLAIYDGRELCRGDKVISENHTSGLTTIEHNDEGTFNTS